MQLNKWRVLALAIAAATAQHAFASEEVTPLAQGLGNSSQAKSNGFIEDSTLHLESRNVAFYKNYKNTEPGTQNYINEWGQAELLRFTSGYTQGVIGFGVDAFANGAVRLNGGGGTGGSQVFPTNASHCDAATGSCQAQDAYGMAGGAVKMRMSETELKLGTLMPQSPVFGTWDGYLMPQHANGGLFSSNEIKNLALQGGHFTSGNADNSTNHDGNLGTAYGWTRVDSATYVGGDYTFSDSLSGGLHAANYEDVWNQYYADLYHHFNISDGLSLLTSLNYYKTDDAGDARAGKINNDAYSIALKLTAGAHSFTVAHQRVNGNTPFDSWVSVVRGE
ncbi:OprD family porin, partial [Pseudomonas laurentiana]|nr:OprD family porin [Pseudomonas laurentiana]